MSPYNVCSSPATRAMRARQRLSLAVVLVVSFVASLSAQPWRANLADNETNFYKIRGEFKKYWSSRRFEIRGGEEGKPWISFKRWEWLMEPRVYPSGELPSPDILQQRMSQYNAAYPPGTQGATAANWTPLGPSVVPSNGGEGRINAIAVDPGNTSIIWAGASSGGLWKSTNGGTTWATTTDQFATLGISAITLDPSNSSTMYIATGDADGLDTYSLGVLKSTDAGATWNPTGLSWTASQGYSIYSLVADPENSLILLAAGRQGIFRTTNGGTSWSTVMGGNFKDLAVDPSNTTVWYAALRATGVYKSTNTGLSFTKLAGGLPASGFTRIAIALAPSLSSTIYALFVNPTDGFYGLYMSADAGATWTLESTSPNILSWDGTGTDGQGSYDLVLDVAPNNPAMVFAGGVNVYRSTNSGGHWTQMTNWYTGTPKPYIHADQHALTFIPGSSTNILEGNDGGVFLTTNSGTSWTDKSGGLAVTQFYRLGPSATNPNRIYAGAQDNGTSRYLSGAWSEIIGGDGMTALIDYTNENIGYGELYFGDIYRTTNGGTTFSEISVSLPDTGGWVTPYVLNPVNPASIYVGDKGVFKSTNRGTTWTTLTGALDPSTLVALAIAPSDSNTLYAATNTRAWVSTNGGTAWSEITAGLPAAALTYVAVHPSSPSTAFATFSGYGSAKVYKTTNFGSSWTGISAGLPAIPVNCIAVNPSAPNDLYVGTDQGVYYSSNSGSAWSGYSTGLPNVIVNELAINASTKKLRAATYGRGLWESPTSVAATGSISGMKFKDVNGNGMKDPADSGLAGWVIHLSAASPPVAMQTSTDADGNYSFSNLDAATYTVAEDQKTGWNQTLPAGGGTYVISLSAGENSTGNDFGNFPMPVAIAGTVFEDVNGDSVFQGGETGLQNWLVRLTGDATDSTLSDSAGRYRFSNLAFGTYTVAEAVQVPWHRTRPPGGSYTVVLSPGDSVVGRDFGNDRYGSITGSKFSDVNRNGVKDSGEAPIQGWVFHLAGPVSGSASSDIAGNYSFGSLPPGSYTVSESVQVGWVQTLPAGNAPYALTMRSGLDTSGLVFGNHQSPEKIYPVLDGWNLLSLPRGVADNHKHSLYPSAISNAFAYAGGYTVIDTLPLGTGFWLKFPSIQNIFIDGDSITLDTVHINPGWNIIGALTASMPVTGIQQIPGGIVSSPYFSYGSLGYQIADSLSPHHGYWVRSGPGGSLVLSTGPQAFGAAKPGSLSSLTGGAATITVTDAGGRSRTLYLDFAGTIEERTAFDLPPVPPEGAFDVRFSNGSTLAAYSSGKADPLPILISSTAYPVKLSWDMAGDAATLTVDGRATALKGRGSLTIESAPARVALRPAARPSAALPDRFSLEQNYPNPFNPTTGITFVLGRSSLATLRVYDVLGREVALLVNEVRPAGVYNVTWDAKGLPSGVYTVRLTAGSYSGVKKMILMR